MNLIVYFLISIAILCLLCKLTIFSFPEYKITRKTMMLPVILIFISSVHLITKSSTINMNNIILSIFSGYLAFCTFTDEQQQKIIVYPSYIMFLIGLFYMYKYNIYDIKTFIFCYIYYIVIHLFIFRKLFAFGDCRMYLVSALFIINGIFKNENAVILFMMHMSLSLFIFWLYNLKKKNITKIAQLKTPAPFAFSIALTAILIF